VSFKFIEEHRFTFSIGQMCRVMNVCPRGLRAFRSRPASRRQQSDLVTLAHIKEQSRLSLGSYGQRGRPIERPSAGKLPNDLS